MRYIKTKGRCPECVEENREEDGERVLERCDGVLDGGLEERVLKLGSRGRGEWMC